jgi:hypothetical protein
VEGSKEVVGRGYLTSKACVWDVMNHFPLPTRYRFATLLAGAQGLFAHLYFFLLNQEFATRGPVMCFARPTLIFIMLYLHVGRKIVT